MLPQFGYIVAQAGVDSRPPPTQSMYTTTNASRPSPPPSSQQQHPPSSYINAPPPLHQKPPYQPTTMVNGPLSSQQAQQHPLYPSYPMTGGAPWMYSTSASINGTTKIEYHTQYYSSNYDRGYMPPPKPSPPPQPTSSIWQKRSLSPISEPVKPPPTSRWHQEDPFELNDSKMVRRLRDCNDVMAWMDHDFKEQRDEMYHEKRMALQKELKSIQDGDHAVFQEQVADLEVERDQAIASAHCFRSYQQTMVDQDIEMDTMVIEEEYKDEKQHLDETILLVMDEYRKQIKEDRWDVELKSLFDQVLERLQQKKQFRKRTTATINGNNGTPRQETSSRGRRLKNTTVVPHNINALSSLQEEDDIETEYLNMKGTIAKRNTTNSRR